MDPVYKMYPPLRDRSDVEALVDGLADGTIDCVATDHAPHSDHEKDVPFEEAPRGVIGLETAAAAVNEAVGLDQAGFFDRMSDAPRRILGRPVTRVAAGEPADLVVFDPERTWVAGAFRSRSGNSPWAGATLRGKVTMTIAGGTTMFREES